MTSIRDPQWYTRSGIWFYNDTRRCIYDRRCITNPSTAEIRKTRLWKNLRIRELPSCDCVVRHALGDASSIITYPSSTSSHIQTNFFGQNDDGEAKNTITNRFNCRKYRKVKNRSIRQPVPPRTHSLSEADSNAYYRLSSSQTHQNTGSGRRTECSNHSLMAACFLSFGCKWV